MSNACRHTAPVLVALGMAAVTTVARAADPDECVARGILKAGGATPLSTIRQQCADAEQAAAASSDAQLLECLRLHSVTADEAATADSLKAECQALIASGQVIPERIIKSRATESNPYVITPLRQNYILPYTYNSSPNQAPYEIDGQEFIEEEEAKLQVSLKVPLTYTDLLTASDGIYFGFTLKSFWQVYNHDISAPFRETNYRPEIFYQAPLPFEQAGGMWIGRVGLEHESNGRSQYLSRSWNRAYVTLGYVAQDWGVAIQPWYRFSEDEKVDDGDPATPLPPDGDDNPDIEDYMGHYEITGAWRRQQLELTGLFRRNFAEGKGAYELGLSFPLWGRLRGYAQYFEGYGESMIDYNHKNQRIGIGVLLTDLL